MSLEINITGAGSSRVLAALVGRLDAQTFSEADARIDTLVGELPESGTLVLDLARLDYISSAGLRTVFRARKLARERGAQVLLVNLQPQVKKVFDVVKAVPVSEVFSSEAELETYLHNLQTRRVDPDDDEGGNHHGWSI